METISIYYPNKNIHLTKNSNEMTYVFIKIANNKKSYLVDTYSLNKNVHTNIKLLLDLFKKNSNL